MRWAGDGAGQPETKEMREGGKVKLMGGKMVWCHAFNAPGQANVVLFVNGFSLVVPRFFFFVALPSNGRKLEVGPVLS